MSGKTPTPETRLARLRQTLQGRKTAVIVIYRNPDPDALSSAWALRELMWEEGVVAQIGFTGEVGRLENRAMIRNLKIPAGPLDPAELRSADLIAVVDSQPDFFRDPPLPRCDIVMDHHPSKSACFSAPFSDIRPASIATASMLTEYLTAAGTVISRRLATALYYGITTDARNLMRSMTAADHEALRRLEPRVHRTLLRRIECSIYSLNQLNYFAIALVKLRHVRNVLYSDIGSAPNADICGQIADFLIRVHESNWALVSAAVENRLVIVFRCDGHQKNAGKTAAAAFGEIGSAGGHPTMGRAEIEAEALPDGTRLTQNEKIERFILGSLAKVEPGFRPIYRALLAETRNQPDASSPN